MMMLSEGDCCVDKTRLSVDQQNATLPGKFKIAFETIELLQKKRVAFFVLLLVYV